MAIFCTKCGASAPADTQFCPNCGNPIAAPAAAGYQPVAAAPYQPTNAPYQPVGAPYQPAAAPYQAGPYQAAPPPKSGGALKVVLIIVAVFVFLGILGAGFVAFSAWRISRAIHIDGSGDNSRVTLHTSGGTISANTGTTYSSSELGTDIYPGSQAGHGGMKMDLPSGSMVSGIFLTSDSKDQVLSFYKSRFGSGASVIDTQDGAMLTLTKSDKETVMVTINAKPGEHDGKTQIAIVHTTKHS